MFEPLGSPPLCRKGPSPLVVCLVCLLFVPGCAATDDPGRARGTFDPCVAAMAPHEGEDAIDVEIIKLQNDMRRGIPSENGLERLGWLFVAKARSGNDPGYYNLAEQCALCMESHQPGGPAALLLRGHVLYNMHRFGEAELLARQLIGKRQSPFDYGLLGDVLMEQGELDEAAGAYQKMVDLKPGLQSYSRAAHIRWLRGDVRSAVDLMQMAADSVSPRDPEAAAWVHSRLSLYELQVGSTDKALQASEAALRFQENHAAALLARGRILLGMGRAVDAVEPLHRAVEVNPLPEPRWALAEALRAAGRETEAESVEDDLVARGALDDPRTTSLYLATRGRDVGVALDLAAIELESRRDVFSLDAHAWALQAAGKADEAHQTIVQALSEGTEDARLLYHAGAIASMVGTDGESCRWLDKAADIQQMLLPSERKDLIDRLSICDEKSTSSEGETKRHG